MDLSPLESPVQCVWERERESERESVYINRGDESIVSPERLQMKEHLNPDRFFLKKDFCSKSTTEQKSINGNRQLVVVPILRSRTLTELLNQISITRFNCYKLGRGHQEVTRTS